MTLVARIGDITIPSGSHSAFPPTPAVEGSPNVFANGIAVVRTGDKYAPHVLGLVVHQPMQDTCSSNVFANGKGIARLGDTTDCGHILALGSPNVFAGD